MFLTLQIIEPDAQPSDYCAPSGEWDLAALSADLKTLGAAPDALTAATVPEDEMLGVGSGGSTSACAPPAAASEAIPAGFVPAAAFAGARAGLIFRTGPGGTGYYPDFPPAAVPLERILQVAAEHAPEPAAGVPATDSPQFVRPVGASSTTAALSALVRNAPKGGGGFGLPMFR